MLANNNHHPLMNLLIWIIQNYWNDAETYIDTHAQKDYFIDWTKRNDAGNDDHDDDSHEKIILLGDVWIDEREWYFQGINIINDDDDCDDKINCHGLCAKEATQEWYLRDNNMTK